MKLTILTLLVFFSIAYTSQVCYDCVPSDANQCLSPHEFNIKTTNCQEDHEKKYSSTAPTDGTSNLEFVCFTIKANSNLDSSASGIYRGCTLQNTDPCEYLANDFKNFTIIICNHCSADKCNIENLDDQTKDGENDSDGAADISVALSALVLNFCILFTLW